MAAVAAVPAIDIALPSSRSRSSSFDVGVFSKEMFSPVDIRYLSVSPSRSPLSDSCSLTMALRRALSTSPMNINNRQLSPKYMDSYESTSGVATLVPPTRAQSPNIEPLPRNTIPTVNIEGIPTAPANKRRTVARRGRSNSRRKINLARLNLDPNVIPWRGLPVAPPPPPLPLPRPHSPSPAKKAQSPGTVSESHKEGSARRSPIFKKRYEPYNIDSNNCFTPPSRRLPTAGIEACKKWLTAPTPPRSWCEPPTTGGTNIIVNDPIVIEDRLAQKEHLQAIVQRVLDETTLALECMTAEQTSLVLHTSYSLSFADMDGYEEMLVLEEKMDELRSCLEKLKILLDEVKKDRKLRKIARDGDGDGGDDDDSEMGDAYFWNELLERIQGDFKKTRRDSRTTPCTFSMAPKLFGEAYVYRRLKGCFESSLWWKDFDPFARKKYDSFLRSREDNLYVSSLFAESVTYGECLFPWEYEDTIKDSFYELTRVYLCSMAYGQTKPTKNVSTDIIDRLWAIISRANGAGLDIVLGDSGQELFRDIAYADFLLQTGLTSRVRLHGKRIPYFVSEATKSDFEWLVRSLSDKKLFPVASHEYIESLRGRINTHRSAGKLVFEDHPFWSTGYTFWDLPIQAPDLFRQLSLSNSHLVLFKGELNYRKLTHNISVKDSAVSFDQKIGPLGHYGRIIGRAEFEMSVVVSFWRKDGEPLVDISDGPFGV
ncbi:hypothetical protein FRB91_000410 [Serendipita sp. 411]|nr:hypothetical protein FRB91_000410 [Serendipita sp. 411]